MERVTSIRIELWSSKVEWSEWRVTWEASLEGSIRSSVIGEAAEALIPVGCLHAVIGMKAIAMGIDEFTDSTGE